MTAVLVIALGVLGLALGAAFGEGPGALLGVAFGVGAGFVLGRVGALSARLDALQREVATLRVALRSRAAEAETPAAAQSWVSNAATSPPPPRPGLVSAPPQQPIPPVPSPVAVDIDAIGGANALPAAPPVSPPAPTSPLAWRAEPQPPRNDPIANFADTIKRWFTEGNVPVKVGMLVLLAGVAALLKYASDQGWLRMPIELRLAGIALAGIAGLVFGWRERERRRSFGLAVQGGAIGVLLLTVYAAFRLYHLVPAPAAFGLMLVLVAGCGLLAVLQDAGALAVIGILAGFAAPILISTGSGNHVVLFTYYALLNAAVFAIAWSKPWRALNLLGFVFTYAIGTTWGVLRYDPAQFSSTEPFLILFFLFYLAIPILYAWRQMDEGFGRVDGTLVFANPLVAFALQAALLEGEREPLAFSALVVAIVYAALAFLVLRRLAMRVLGESFAVLALGFATLAVPLAFSARSTACTFALEGAALVWLGFRQSRDAPRVIGLALQALAAIAFIAGLDSLALDVAPIANGTYISAMLIAVAAFICAWLHYRAGSGATLLLYFWALAWWVGTNVHEIDRFVAQSDKPAAMLAFAALTALLAAEATARIKRNALAWTVAVALALGVPIVFAIAGVDARPFAGWYLGAFALYAAFGFRALVCLRDDEHGADAFAHGGWIWTWTLALALALRDVGRDAALAEGWRFALAVLPLLAAWMLTLIRPNVIAPPLRERFPRYRPGLLGTQTIVAIALFALSLPMAGDSAPIAFVPLLNPLELIELAMLGCLARWLYDDDAPDGVAFKRSPVLAAFAFAFVTIATLRAVHHLDGAPWDARMLDSHLAQTSLTVVWSVLGVLGWVIGSRRGNRALWTAGALLMAVVLAKLLLVDRSHLGNLFGIASFIAYGLLCTVVGYFAPAPPRGATAEVAT